MASAIAQSGSTADHPYYEAGLNGTGQVVHVADTGLDEVGGWVVAGS